MRNLETSIAAWRKTMLTTPHVGPETLDELETHLREAVEELIRSGVAEPEAFHRAVSQLGAPLTVASEFRKLNPSTWLPIKVIAAIGVVEVLAFSFFPVAAFRHRGWDVLLAAHLFTVTLGYSAALLLGLLGVCFVCQRCRSDFSARRLESICRVGIRFARLAACLTAIGVVLGMAWSKREWGRLWGWDPREIGGLCVMVWLLGFLAAHHFRRLTPHLLLVFSILGGNVVALGWFGPSLLLGPHDYGRLSHSWLLLAVVMANLVFFLIGLAPVGWLRLRKA